MFMESLNRREHNGDQQGSSRHDLEPDREVHPDSVRVERRS